MTVKLVTYEDTRAMLLELAQEFPDRFVRQCTYAFEDGQPNCLIGVALARWGVPGEVLLKMGGRAVRQVLTEIKSYLEFTHAAAELLRFAQIFQDAPADGDDYESGFSAHMPWAEAVKRAFAQVEGMSDDGSGL